MNDFSEIEQDLKKLHPARPSANLLTRIEDALVDLSAEVKIVRPQRFGVHWLSLGASLAAAAVVLIFLRFDFQKQTKAPLTAANPPTNTSRSTFIPLGATQVVYHTRDEGLYFPAHSEEPMRRWRSRTQETWQWRNPATGASIQVSYPAEHVELTPVYGQ